MVDQCPKASYPVRVAVFVDQGTCGDKIVALFRALAAPSLQPAFARAIESAGHIPLAIRLQDICDGRLTTQNFQVVALPGGTVAGYSYGLWGHEKAILNFVYQGGSYYGVCGGAYYASKRMVWEGYPYYDGPLLGLFPGADTGPLTEIAAWPNWALTPVRINDPILGDMGTQQQMYYGGGWKSRVAGVAVAATYAAQGAHYGAPRVMPDSRLLPPAPRLPPSPLRRSRMTRRRQVHPQSSFLCREQVRHGPVAPHARRPGGRW